MKILFIDVNYALGSTGGIVKALTEQLRTQGHEVLVLYGRGGDSLEAKKVAKPIEVYLDVFLTRLTGFIGIFSPLSTRRVIAEIESFKPDVVHLHDLHGYFINFMHLANYLKAQNISTVWSFHSEFMYTGKCAHSYDCNAWQTHCDQCPQIDSYPKSWWFDQTSLMFDAKKKLFKNWDAFRIIIASEWLKVRCDRSEICGNNRKVVIPNPVAKDFFNIIKDRLMPYREKYKISLLFSGSSLMTDNKGGGYIEQLCNFHPDVLFVIAGDDEFPIIADNILNVGYIKSSEELACWYKAVDATIVLSKRETFSMVAAESLACGTPVIGFDSGGPSEVAPYPYGCFVEYGDIASLSGLVEQLKSKTLTLKGEASCRGYAVAHFGVNVVANSHLDVYQELIHRD